jgi:hypothetical protein
MSDDTLALARRAVALGLTVGDREMQAWGRLWSMDVHAANGRRVELLGELAALTVLAEQLGPAWQSQVHAHSAEYQVPAGQYLVLGDNRDVSSDSRSWSRPYVPQAALRGRLVRR